MNGVSTFAAVIPLGPGNHLLCKLAINHLGELAKWLSCAVSTYLYSAFDGMLLPCPICVLEWILIKQIAASMSRNSLLKADAISEV